MANSYSQSWDAYVTQQFPAHQRDEDTFPGDEWGTPETWDHVYRVLLEAAGANAWQKAVEIGPGSGKYTHLLMERSACSILAADISNEFLNVLKQRKSAAIESGQLQPWLIPGADSAELYRRIEQAGWLRQVDGFFSIDAMVHVDLQYLMAYFLTAALVLRPGGKLVLTLADATTERGQQKLLDDVRTYYPMQGMPSLKFEFVDASIVRAVLSRLGFTLTKLDHDDAGPARGRDLFVIAELTDLTHASELARCLGV